MAKKKIFILGAGLAGLSAAWHLEKKGIDCQVFEKEPEVGGLCRSKNVNGFTFDCDGHLLHFKHRYTLDFIKSLLGNNLARHKRSAWIYFYDRYIPYPFQASLDSLPSPVKEECLEGLIQARKDNRQKSKKNLNFHDWINRALGKGIARHFMVPYNAKFWTLPPRELTCEWLDGLIPVPPLSRVIKGPNEGNREGLGYNAEFWYPERGGIGQLPLALASSLKGIRTNCKVLEIDLHKKYIKTSPGGKERFDYLISTIPLPEMRRLIKDLPQKMICLFDKLSWNSIFNLNLGIDRKDSFKRHWAYFLQKEICFFRVGFPHHFSFSLAPPDRGSLYVEVAYSKHSPIDKSKIVVQIRRDLEKVGILSGRDKIRAQDINDIKYGYPIYDINYSVARKAILSFLGSRNLLSCGRYGSWRYMSMEGSLLDARQAINLIH